MKYFDKFPVVNYNGFPAKNLLSKVYFTDNARKNIYSNFDFTLTQMVTRPDLLSSSYYENSNYDWLILLTNKVIDPYYDFYMNDYDLNKVVESKYGSISNALATILFYRNNWAADESNISVALYNSLDASIKKYYTARINTDNQIISYARNQNDWIRSTNRIDQLTLSNSASYSIGDIFSQGSSRGTIVNNDIINGIITLHHISGNFTLDSSVLSANTLVNVIPLAESSFWISVNAYEHEIEKNEAKRYISLIKSAYVQDVENRFIENIRK
jgi:hypothetical protein